MGRRFRFFSVFAVLSAFFYINTGFAISMLPVTYDYSCPSYKKYYECSSGYYLSDCGTSGWTGQSISSPAFGNSCEECPSGYTCSGGTVCPKSSGVTCSPGYYLKANYSTCSTCGSNAFYCPGGTFTPSSSTDQGRNSVTAGYYSTGGTSTTRTGQSQCGGNTYFCQSGVRYTVTSGYYTTGGTSTTRTGQSQCTGATYCSSGYKYNCPSGYTANTTARKTSSTQCQIRCYGGTYIASRYASSCSNVGTGYWAGTSLLSYGSTGTRYSCDSGLTTIGYGSGADEQDDCGRILHIGTDKIYLRSKKKTTPSLNVQIEGITFYGNMSTSVDGPLKIGSGNTTYSVYDDSME